MDRATKINGMTIEVISKKLKIIITILNQKFQFILKVVYKILQCQ